MPAKSQAQFRLMKAAAAGKVPGISKSTGKEFTGAYVGRKGSVKRLPARKRSPRA
jgi:hypothetical protein